VVQFFGRQATTVSASNSPSRLSALNFSSAASLPLGGVPRSSSPAAEIEIMLRRYLAVEEVKQDQANATTPNPRRGPLTAQPASA
jgi:hypothetical protein